jgi:hypothetical protein
MVPIEGGHPTCFWYPITISHNPNLELWNMGWLASQGWVLYKIGQGVCNEYNYLTGPSIYNVNIIKSGQVVCNEYNYLTGLSIYNGNITKSGQAVWTYLIQLVIHPWAHEYCNHSTPVGPGVLWPCSTSGPMGIICGAYQWVREYCTDNPYCIYHLPILVMHLHTLIWSIYVQDLFFNVNSTIIFILLSMGGCDLWLQGIPIKGGGSTNWLLAKKEKQNELSTFAD